MVVISTQRLQKILPIGDAKQVLCFAGAGIFSVQEALNLVVNDGLAMMTVSESNMLTFTAQRLRLKTCKYVSSNSPK